MGFLFNIVLYSRLCWSNCNSLTAVYFLSFPRLLLINSSFTQLTSNRRLFVGRLLCFVKQSRLWVTHIVLKADTSWEATNENDEMEKRKQLSKNQSWLFLDQYHSSENVRIINKVAKKVSFKCRPLNIIKLQAFKF